jgi:hypothetical protein
MCWGFSRCFFRRKTQRHAHTRPTKDGRPRRGAALASVRPSGLVPTVQRCVGSIWMRGCVVSHAHEGVAKDQKGGNYVATEGLWFFSSLFSATAAKA